MRIYILHYRRRRAGAKNGVAHMAVLCDQPEDALRFSELRRGHYNTGVIIASMQATRLDEAPQWLVKLAEGLVVRTVDGHLRELGRRRKNRWRFSSRIRIEDL